jgi:hypothetical protein
MVRSGAIYIYIYIYKVADSPKKNGSRHIPISIIISLFLYYFLVFPIRISTKLNQSFAISSRF